VQNKAGAVINQVLITLSLWSAPDETLSLGDVVAIELSFPSLPTIQQLKNPKTQDDLGIGVEADLKVDSTASAVSFSYAFVIADEAMTKALGLAHTPTSNETFEAWGGGMVYLAGRPVIRTNRKATAEDAIELSIKAQATCWELPEATAAAGAYRRAEEATRELKQHIERLSLTLEFPRGTRCELCGNLAPGVS
jgi:hypothetical protein